MLRNAFDVGRLFGIRVRLNWSVSVIFVLIVFHLVVGVLPYWHPEWSAAMSFAVALAAAIVFFVSLLLHELAHALTAQAYGIPVRSITLFLFGGVSDIQEEPERPGIEAAVTIVGPLTSAALGALFLFIFSQIRPPPASEAEIAFGMAETMGPVATVLAWVGPINILLALFNLIPAFPLDGGRLLRALLWWQSGNLSSATRWAAMISRGLAFAFIAVGVLMAFGLYVPFLGGGPVAGLWIVFIGWFLAQAAAGTYTQVVISDALADTTVGQLTDRDIVTVPPEMSIAELVDNFAATRPQTAYPVVDPDGEDGVRGVVSLAKIRSISSDLWEDTRVTAIMDEPDETRVTSPGASADEALNTMLEHGREELVVVGDGDDKRVEGLLHQDNVLRWVRMHTKQFRR